MKFKSSIAWMITVLTLASTLIACGSKDNNENTPTDTKGSETVLETETETDTRELTDLEKRQLVTDGLEDVDFNKAEFRIVTGEEEIWQFYVESETGDPCNDAVWKRNAKIENRFNVIINSFSVGRSAEILEKILQGENFCELMTYGIDRMGYFIENHVLYDWNDIPVIKLDSPWYNQATNESCTINDHLYTLATDMAISSLTYTYAMFFNPTLLANYGFNAEDLYDYVVDGTWTFDKFITISKDIYADQNLNNERDEEDIFGFMHEEGAWHGMDAWPFAFGHEYSSYDVNSGELTIFYATDTMVAADAKMREYLQSAGVFTRSWADDELEFFVNGSVAFVIRTLNDCFGDLRVMEDYGVIPIPKFNEAQESYYTTINREHNMMTIPYTVQEDSLEFIGTIVEALSCESYRSVFPTYFDSALKGRYAKVPQVAKMMDYIEQGRKIDVIQLFGESLFDGFDTGFANGLSDKSNLATQWAMMERRLKVILPKFYDAFTEQ